jgi:hypothetical protein
LTAESHLDRAKSIMKGLERAQTALAPSSTKSN